MREEYKAHGFTYRTLIHHPERERDRAAPPMIFLHGVGERGRDIAAACKHGLPKLLMRGMECKYVVFTPQCEATERWSLVKLRSFVQEVLDEVSATERRVILCGFSMGGFATWAFAADSPQLLQAAVPIAGGGDPASVRKLLEVPIWAFHGGADTVVPLESSEEMVEACADLGKPVPLTIYPKDDHCMAEKPFLDQKLWSWLDSQRLVSQ